ncbi:MAG: hypothetical protein ACXWT3_10875 [Methylococcaceae bacterium]
MLLMIGLRPFLDGLIAVSLIADIFFASILFAGVFALSKEKWPLTLALCLAMGIVMIKIAQYFFELTVFDFLNEGISGLFLMQIFVMVMRHIQTETEVTADLLMGAVCRYLLLGVVWAYAYNFLELAHPHFFNGSEHFGDKM